MSGSVLLDGALGALGLAIVLVAVAVAPARPRQRGVAGALAAIEQRYTQQAVAVAQRAADPTAMPAWLRGLALWLSPSGIATTLQRRLDRAGNPAPWNPDRILAVKGLGLLILGGLAAVIGLHSPLTAILYAGIGGTAGFFLPDLLLYNAGMKRQAKIQKNLPDTIDMLTVSVEAGLGFDAALAQVARNSEGPVAAEFARALQEMQIGVSRTQAMRAMALRSTVPELQAFVSAMVQASELGIAVAQVLREQAKELRVRRRQRAEERAQKVPIKILFPLIFCLFPLLFIILMGPAAIRIAAVLFGV